MYHEELKIRRKELSNLFGLVTSLLSTHSLHLTTSHQNYPEAEEQQDGFKLWKIVYNQHITSDPYMDRGVQKLKIQQRLYNIHQKINEDIHTYYESFQQALQNYNDFNLTKIPDREQAILFLQGLNRQKYDQLHQDINNCPNQYLYIHKTLHEAYSFAVNYRCSTNNRNNLNINNVFNTESRRNHKKYKNKHHHNNNGNNNKSDNNKNDNQQNNTQVNQQDSTNNSNTTQSNGDNSNGEQLKYCKYHKYCKHSTSECNKLKKASLLELVNLSTNNSKPNIPLILSTETENDINDPDYDDPNVILLDSCAQISLFNNANPLSNITTIDEDIFISGINNNGEFIRTNYTGKYNNISKFNILISNKVKRNVIYLADIVKNYNTKWDHKNQIFTIIGDNDNKLKFKIIHDVLCMIHNYQPDYQVLFTNNEKRRAELVKEIQRKLAYESDSGLSLAIKQSAISNLPVTSKDIKNARSLFGPDIAAIKGKSTTSRTKITQFETSDKLEDKSLQLYMDIMYINKDPYLITISKPMNLTTAIQLREFNKNNPKTSNAVEQAIISIINTYRSHSYFIYELYCDNDSVFHTLPKAVNPYSCKVNYVAPKSDTIATIDRKIRFIKDRCRSILCGLPYKVPSYLFKYLISFVISRINLINHSYTNISNTSPKELLTGIRTDYNKDIRHYFGEYIQAIVPESDNSMNERTNGCIALSPSDDKDGSILCFHIKTRRIIKRNKWISLPITEDIIEVMNNLAKEENGEIIFEYQNEKIEDDNTIEELQLKPHSIDKEYQLVRSLPDGHTIEYMKRINEISDQDENQINTGRIITRNENYFDPDDLTLTNPNQIISNNNIINNNQLENDQENIIESESTIEQPNLIEEIVNNNEPVQESLNQNNQTTTYNRPIRETP